jgi:hypothetical protein
MNIRYRLKDYLNLSTHTALGIGMSGWLHLLWKNRLAINVFYLPKVIFITTTVFLSIPLQLIERFRFHKKIKRTSVAPPVFILGHPRSGTTYLQYILSKDPAFAFCTTTEGLLPNIFLTAGKFAETILKAAMPETRPQDNVKAGATLPIEEEFAMGSMSNASWVHGLYFPKNIYRAFDEYVTFTKGEPEIKQHWKKNFNYFLKKLSFKYPGKNLLLKSPANTGRLKELYELYPDAKFIHIYRNPIDVFLSTERLFEKILPLIGFQKASNAFMREHVLYAYEQLYSKYLEDRKSIPAHQLYEFSYEDFISAPMDIMKKAYAHLSLGDFNQALPFFEEELRHTRDYKPNTYLKIDETLRQEILKRWGFAFTAFGYKKNTTV